MLSKLAYLTLCRSIQVLMLLVRGDAEKDPEILVLRHQLTVLRRHTPAARSSLGSSQQFRSLGGRKLASSWQGSAG